MRKLLNNWRRLGGAFALCAAALAGVHVFTPTSTAATYRADDEDVLVLKDTNIEIKGKIVEETDTKIKIKGTLHGISFEREYDKADIVSIKRAVKKDDADTSKATPTPGTNPGTTPAATPTKDQPKGGESEANKVKYYHLKLEGQFGVDVTQTPIRKAIKDAQNNSVDLIIVELNCTLHLPSGEKVPEDIAGAFDQIFRAEEITPIFVEEIPKQWTKKPRVVFWVREAMGGAALMPFICPEMYMSSEARIGGIGYLTELIKRGDKVVQQKQYSLRLGHAQGWLISGGYDFRLINAMTVRDYVLSYKPTGDGPIYFERMPDPLQGEILLTDDGLDSNLDSVQDRVRGTGNDVLTFNAKLAKDLRVSKGTADTMSDLLFLLGIDRTGVEVKGRSDQIMTGWTREVVDAKKRLRTLLEDFATATVNAPGGYDERKQYRGAQISRLEQMKSIMKQYKEALDQFWMYEYGIPDEVSIQKQIDTLKMDQMSDKAGR